MLRRKICTIKKKKKDWLLQNMFFLSRLMALDGHLKQIRIFTTDVSSILVGIVTHKKIKWGDILEEKQGNEKRIK